MAMRPGKPELDQLLDETLALVTAATAPDAGSNGFPLTQRSNKFAIENGQDSLVEEILSLIAQLSHGALEANEAAWKAEHGKMTDDIGRMAAELDTLRSQVNDFKERQRKLRQDRDAPTAEAKP
jgi:hypothetical protein